MIIRLTDVSEDAEILQMNKLTNQEYFASVSMQKVAEKIVEFTSSPYADNKPMPTFLDKSIIAVSENLSSIMINQPEHIRIVTYKQKAYKINFPNAIYIMYQHANKVTGIAAFTYKQYKGIDTELYRYPMPNMLGGNMICIGTAPKDIKNLDFTQALEAIIHTQYTHNEVNDIKSFSSTHEYFDYLTKNEFPYHLLIELNKKLKNYLREA